MTTNRRWVVRVVVRVDFVVFSARITTEPLGRNLKVKQAYQ